MELDMVFFMFEKETAFEMHILELRYQTENIIVKIENPVQNERKPFALLRT